MTPERRAEIVKILESSAAAFHSSVTATPEEHARVRPAADRWSVLEIAEHVVLAEHGMFRLLSAAVPVEASLENPARETAITTAIMLRATPAPAPERVKPTGRFADLAQALQQFAAARAKTIQFATETELDLFRLSAPHPLFGPVNGYEFLLIMAGP